MLWFPILTAIVNWLLILFLPRRLTWREIYLTSGVIIAIALNTDIVLDLIKHRYHYLCPPPETITIIIEDLVPASFGILYLHFLPKNKLAFWPYLLGWTLLSVLYEWINVQIQFLVYVNWNLAYSAVVYLLVFLFLRWHWHVLKRND